MPGSDFGAGESGSPIVLHLPISSAPYRMFRVSLHVDRNPSALYRALCILCLLQNPIFRDEEVVLIHINLYTRCTPIEILQCLCAMLHMSATC